jgi:hypothetical protein
MFRILVRDVLISSMKNLADGIPFLRYSALKRRDIPAQAEALRH